MPATQYDEPVQTGSEIAPINTLRRRYAPPRRSRLASIPTGTAGGSTTPAPDAHTFSSISNYKVAS
jgi:hypothetical protein